jgi:hypothetical protein
MAWQLVCNHSYKLVPSVQSLLYTARVRSFLTITARESGLFLSTDIYQFAFSLFLVVNPTLDTMSMRPVLVPHPSVFELVLTQQDVAQYFLAFIRAQMMNPTVEMGSWTPYLLPAL